MKQTAWADLPNAKHIDRIIANLERNPYNWGAARTAAWDDAWTAAWNAAWDAVWDAARGAAWGSARYAAGDAARYSAWTAARGDARGAAASGAILALITYDDCAYLLDEKPEHVQMLGLLGNQAALLLYPACVAMQKEMA